MPPKKKIKETIQRDSKVRLKKPLNSGKSLELNRLTAHELINMVNNKEATFEEIISSLKKRLKAVESKIKAYVRLMRPDSTGLELVKGGIPVAIKDNICVKNEKSYCCSKILEGFISPYDATVIEKLKNASFTPFGKTNMDEFAFGSSTENSLFGPTHNPWDLARVPGGSSGGSAAAVASDEAILALGSDTGGSIRQPASFCGVVGLKPTYGRVSRFGLIAFASSLDQIGPITKDVRDCALLMNAIAGYDERDSTSVDIKVPDYSQSLIKEVKGIKIGIPKEYFVEGIANDIKEAVLKAIDILRDLGAEVYEVSLPHTEYAVPTYYIIATAEASSNLARFDGVQYGYRRASGKENRDSLIEMYCQTRGSGFGPEAKRRIILGTYVLSSGYYEAYYLRAQKVRRLIKDDFDGVFKKVDCIITPTSPTPAFKIGEKVENPLSMYLSDIYTISANLAGIPAISIPCGFSNEALPVGLQILAKPFAEEMLLRVAYAYEQNTPWHLKKPNI